jgi:hypothetical protein
MDTLRNEASSILQKFSQSMLHTVDNQIPAPGLMSPPRLDPIAKVGST